MFEKISKAFTALKAGESLANPATWKSVQLLGNALTVVLTFGVLFIPQKYAVSQEQVNGIVAGIVSFAGVWNSYFTKATTTKTLPGITKLTLNATTVDPVERPVSVEVPATSESINAGRMQSNRAEMPTRTTSPLTGE